MFLMLLGIPQKLLRKGLPLDLRLLHLFFCSVLIWMKLLHLHRNLLNRQATVLFPIWIGPLNVLLFLALLSRFN